MSTLKKFAVIGHPIGQSQSPTIHNHWIKKYGLSATYEAIDIAPEALKTQLLHLLEQGFEGFNITIPHKESVGFICDEIQDTAQKIGSINTLYKRGSAIIGTNTDGFGFLQNILKAYPEYDVSGKTACVLGAGGAAKSIIHSLTENNIKQIILCNRTREKAEDIAALYESIVQVIDWDDKENAAAKYDLLINTTSLGMTGQPPLTFDFMNLNSTALVTDIVYKPLMTPLLNAAQKKGNPVVTGIGMLIYQAAAAFEKFHGIMPEIDDELRAKVMP